MFRRILTVSSACLLLLSAALAYAAEASSPRRSDATRTVIDQNGDEITLPADVERVVIISPWPLPSVYALFMGGGERIAGIHPASQSAAKHSFLIRVAPEIAEAETGFIRGNEVNIEELMNLNPDVVLYSAGNDAQKKALENAGIPGVAFSPSIAGWNAVETVNQWMRLLGEIFGDEVKSDEIITYSRQIEEMVLGRVRDIPEEEKPRALILFRYGDTEMQTVGAGHFGQYWLTTAGAANVAGGETGAIAIGMEQVLEWNPDKVFITTFSPYLVEDFMSGTVGNDDWSAVKAVLEGEVYKFPLGMYRWYPPSSDSPLALLWLAKQIHPELFADVDLEQEIKYYYRCFYGVALTDDDLATMMNPPREAAGGV